MTIDMKNLQAPGFLYDEIIGGPCLPFVSNLVMLELVLV